MICALYNVWGDADYLLPYSINQIKEKVDKVLIVYSDYSNSGEYCPPKIPKEESIHYEPNLYQSPAWNETRKRNIGIEWARKNGFTHFIHLDCDELYETHVFEHWMYKAMEHDGSACRMFTYYKTPDIRISPPEEYYVPFVHKIYPNTLAGQGSYPLYVDPTRKINTHKSFLTIPMNIMHHYSWVRKDIRQKLRNSSAYPNFKNRIDSLVEGFETFEKTGKMVFFDNHSWVKSENKFGIHW